SITYAGQYVEYFEAFLRLQNPHWQGELLNLGLPSETVSGLSEGGHAGGQFPRPDLHERLGRVLAQTKPDLVIACYGMNDGIYQPLDETRFAAFRSGIEWLREQALTNGARIIHLTPPTFDPKNGRADMPPGENYNTVLDRYSDWLLEQREHGWNVVDLHGPMNRFLAEQRAVNPDYRLAGDGVHPNETGHWLMAAPLMVRFGAPAEIAGRDSVQPLLAGLPQGEDLLRLVRQRQRLLKDAWLTATGHKRPGMSRGVSLADAQAQSAQLDARVRALYWPLFAKRGAWNGFDRYDFPVTGRTLSIIAPKEPLPGRLWAWKGEFLDAFPATEIDLLNRGVHVIYLSAPDLLGCPEAVRLWNAAYAELTGAYAFAPKPALIALSRAGLYCYNWAAANPEEVACVYADAAVCDFKSWPGGRGSGKGSARDWQLVLKDYGFASDAEALAYHGNPVDNLEPLAKAGVPLLHVYGEADDVVPWQENTGVVAERYRTLGGEIT
ncbi:MAG: SGNH/GDSL hydrolase family protein, partial [Verrucomicrobiae bacterium]|nr:SGNH/GDSL hydrolase family protein [Verrucomicrobiae bacterium]